MQGGGQKDGFTTCDSGLSLFAGTGVSRPARIAGSQAGVEGDATAGAVGAIGAIAAVGATAAGGAAVAMAASARRRRKSRVDRDRWRGMFCPFWPQAMMKEAAILKHVVYHWCSVAPEWLTMVRPLSSSGSKADWMATRPGPQSRSQR